jgi:putative transposase
MVGVLLRLAHLGVTNTFAMLRLLPVSNRDKDVEILALRHQIMVLQRQLGERKTRFEPTDRALLAALLHRLPIDVLPRVRLLGPPRHRLALAPRPDRPPARGQIQTE